MSTNNATSSKWHFQNEEEMKTIPDKQKMREFVASRPALQIVLKGVLQAKNKKTLEINSNRHEQIKSTSKGNYIGKYKRQ